MKVESNNRKVFEILAVLALGVGSFFLVIGYRVLEPSNIAWLNYLDPAQHFLGWCFFRHSAWSFPIGLNPNFGLEISNAIVFSDSNPLLAILFKPFSSLLPEPFQYFGIWLLACFILQSWFGWKLIGLFSNSTSIRLLSTALFVFSPPMICRLIFGHSSLAGHFLILAALYLTLRPKHEQENRLVSWGAVLLIAALVHAYLFAMVGCLWLVDLTERRLKTELTIKNLLREFILLVLIIGVTCWQAGYFSVSHGIADKGFGIWRMNLLSIITPASWSYFLTGIPIIANGDYEGFSFLGSGIFILMLLSIPVLISNRVNLVTRINKRPMLLLALIGLTLFALSNNIGIGAYNFKYPLPTILLNVASIFRASGRMFWPVFYMLIIFMLFIVIRGYSRRIAIYLLTLAAAVQIVDTSSGWLDLREMFMVKPASAWETPLQNPFWKLAATKYKKVRIIPFMHRVPYWKFLEIYAYTYGMATDAVYLARVDANALAIAKSNAETALNTGKYALDSLYIIDQRVISKVAQTINKDTDLLMKIDGLIVLAPGWHQNDDLSNNANKNK